MRAAKCRIASTPSTRRTSPMRTRSATSASTKTASAGTASRWPADRAPTTTTSWPARRSTSAMWEPMYPAPPVTRTLIERQRQPHKTRAAYRDACPVYAAGPRGKGLLGRRLGHAGGDRRQRAIAPACLAARATDGCHVSAVPAHDFAALAAGVARLVCRELVRAPLGVGCLAALARDLALLGQIHGSESPVALGTIGAGRCRHVVVLLLSGPDCSACAVALGIARYLESLA